MDGRQDALLGFTVTDDTFGCLTWNMSPGAALKLQDWTMQDWTIMTEWTMTDVIASCESSIVGLHAKQRKPTDIQY